MPWPFSNKKTKGTMPALAYATESAPTQPIPPPPTTVKMHAAAAAPAVLLPTNTRGPYSTSALQDPGITAPSLYDPAPSLPPSGWTGELGKPQQPTNGAKRGLYLPLEELPPGISDEVVPEDSLAATFSRQLQSLERAGYIAHERLMDAIEPLQSLFAYLKHGTDTGDYMEWFVGLQFHLGELEDILTAFEAYSEADSTGQF
jgi:hypothetical protein